MAKHNLTDQQMTAAILYSTRKSRGMTAEDVAKEVGVSRRQIYRWLQNDEFKRFMNEQMVEIVRERSGDVLEVLTRKALEGSNAKFMQLYLQVAGLIGAEANVAVNVNTDNDERSTESIESDLAELKKMLSEYDEGLN